MCAVLYHLNCLCSFPIFVSRVGRGIRLYRFMITAFLSTCCVRVVTLCILVCQRVSGLPFGDMERQRIENHCDFLGLLLSFRVYIFLFYEQLTV